MKNILAALLLISSCLPGMAQQKGTVWLGAGVESLTKAETDALGWQTPHGARVKALTPGGPAEKSGLKRDDILVSLDGVEITDGNSFIDAVLDKTPGAVIKLSVRRSGLEQQIAITLGERPIVVADSGPQLMLDTGGHMAIIVDLAITPDGSQLVSASNDKTIRVWDIATGRTIRTIRGESSPGSWGTIYAMALSPDGRWLAAGGFLSEADQQSASAIRLYDFASGKIVKVLKAHRDVVLSLTFSSDSKRLLSGSADKTAMIWDVAGGRMLMQLAGHADAVDAVAFSKDGTRAATGSDDESIRLWDASDGKPIAEMTEHKAIIQRENPGKFWKGGVKAVAFSADGRLIASGSKDGRVMLWDGATGAFQRQLSFPGGMLGGAAVNSLQFSPDSKRLLFASEFEGCSIYDIESGKEIWDGKLREPTESRYFSDVKRENCTGGAAYSADGSLAVAAYNGTIHLLDPNTGKATRTLQSSGATVFAAGFAKDGRSIAWGTDLDGSQPGFPRLMYRLDLPLNGTTLTAPEPIAPPPAEAPQPPKEKSAGDRPRLSTGLDSLGPRPKSPDEDNYARRLLQSGPLSVDFKHVDRMLMNSSLVEISKDGAVQKQIELQGEGGKHSVLSFTPDAQTVLAARSNRIEAYTIDGSYVGTFQGHLATVRDFAVSPDGRFLVSGSSDQTVRLWNMQSRELIVSLFFGADGEWVVWTPQGYYASSPNGDRIVGWQINKGQDQAAEYVTANQLRYKFYRPDIVDRAIVLGDAARAVEEMNAAGASGFKLSDLAERLPPKLAVLSPRGGSQTSNGRAVIELSLAEAAGDPVNRFDIFVNDIKVTPAAKRSVGMVGFEVPLAEGSNRVRVVAHSATNLLGEAVVDIAQRGEGALDKRDTLFILAVGADKYPNLPKACGPQGNAACDLAFAGADAKAFAETIEKQMGRQHLRIVKKVLVNGAGGDLEPIRANVETALGTLLKAKDNDTVAVFIAGHGTNDPRGGYQFLPSDARFADDTNLAPTTVVKWAVLEDAIQSAKGRRLLFVDTCRSTNAFNPRLMKDASDEAIVAFSATNTQQDALELPSLGHGAFTNAVVKGLNGAADIAQEREVRVFDLGAYVEREVRKLTKGLQTPDFYKKPGAENFVMVRMMDETAAMETKSAAAEVQQPQREVPPKQPEKTPVSAAPDKPAKTKVALAPEPPVDPKPAPAPVPAPAEAKAPALSMPAAEEAVRLKRGQAALELDDIAGARLIFEYLANHGSAAGAYQLALTYDPKTQSLNPLASTGPDAKMAEHWYRKAAELGHPEARKKIAAQK